MQIIETIVYSFNELNEKAKEKAIEKIRMTKYESGDIPQWAIDDCYLFEPSHIELSLLFNERYNKLEKPILGNTRKLYFDLERNRHIDADEAIIVNYEDMFLEWLGIPKFLSERLYWRIKDNGHRYADTIIEFEPNEHDYEFTDEENKILTNAIDKFSSHMEEVLDKIEKNIDYYYSDEAIIEDIESNDYQFTENGTIF
jgi:hypothetical protein